MRLISDMLGNLFQEEDLVYGPHPAPAGWQQSSPLGAGSSTSGGLKPLASELQPRGESGFAGLMNQGTTCYLNSLLQTMFMTPELRSGLYQVSAADLGIDVGMPLDQGFDQSSSSSSGASARAGDGDSHARAGELAGSSAGVVVVGTPARGCGELAAPPPATRLNDDGLGTEREQAAGGAAVEEQEEDHWRARRGEEGSGSRHDEGSGKMSEAEAVLVAMGFSIRAVKRALKRHRGYMVGAVEWLLDGGDSNANDDDVEESGEGGGTVKDKEGAFGPDEMFPASVDVGSGFVDERRHTGAEISAPLAPEQPFATASAAAGGAIPAVSLGEEENKRCQGGGEITGSGAAPGMGEGDVNSLLWRVELQGVSESENWESVNDGDSACAEDRDQSSVAIADVNGGAVCDDRHGDGDDNRRDGEEDPPVSGGKGTGGEVMEEGEGGWCSGEGGIEAEGSRFPQVDANKRGAESRAPREGEEEEEEQGVSSRLGLGESDGGDMNNGLVHMGVMESWLEQLTGGGSGEGGGGGGGADPGVASGGLYESERIEAGKDGSKEKEETTWESGKGGLREGVTDISRGGEGGVKGGRQGHTSSSNNNKPKRKVRRGLAELQKLFAWLQAVDQKAFSTEALTRSFGWDGGEAREQHDVHELNRLLFDAIEQSLKGTPQEQLIADLYHGTLVNQVECLRCGNISEREEAFGDIPIVIKGFSSLEESMAAAAQAEVLRGDNQYFCERCQCKVDARRSQRLRCLPPVLTLPLCRFEYDWQNDERRKISTHFSFPLLLDLAPYVADLNTEHGSIGAWPMANTVQGEVEELGGGKSCIMEKDLSGVPNMGQKESVCDDTYKYDLLSVVIHSGNAHSGHYHAYIRDLFRTRKRRTSSREEHRERQGEACKRCVSSVGMNTTDARNTDSGSTRDNDDREPLTGSAGGLDTGQDVGAQQERGLCGDNVYQLLAETPKSEERLACDSTTDGNLFGLFNTVKTGEECSCMRRAENVEQEVSPSERGTISSEKADAGGAIRLEEEQHTQDDEDDQLWYDFNDSTVTQMTGFAIEKQFGGSNECAYMLTYRARAPAGRACEVMDDEPLGNGFVGPGHGLQYGHDMGTACSRKAERRHSLMDPATLGRAVQLPWHLQALVDKANEDLKCERELADAEARKEAARAEAEAAAARMRLTVHLPTTCIIGGGYLANKPEDSSDTERVLVLEKKSTVGQLATVILAQFSKWLPVPDKSRMMLYVVSPPRCAPRGIADGLMHPSLFLKQKSAVVLRDVDGDESRDGSLGEGLHLRGEDHERRVDSIDDKTDNILLGDAKDMGEGECDTPEPALSTRDEVTPLSDPLVQVEKKKSYGGKCCAMAESNKDVREMEQTEERELEGTVMHTKDDHPWLDSKVMPCDAAVHGLEPLRYPDYDASSKPGTRSLGSDLVDVNEKTWGLTSNAMEEEGNEDLGNQLEVASITSSAGSSKREESDSGAGFMDEEGPGGEGEAVTCVCQILGALPTFRAAARLVDVGFVDGGGVLPWDREWGPLECYEDRTRLVGINIGTMKSTCTVNGEEERLGQPVGWSSRVDSTALGQVNSDSSYKVFVKDCTQGDSSSSWGQIRDDQLLTVMASPDMTICELKALALQQREQLEGYNSPAHSNVMLRRTTAGGAPAEPLSQEFRTLKATGICHGQLVIMELLTPQSSTQPSLESSLHGNLRLHLSVIDKGGTVVLEKEPVDVEMWCTVGDCKGLLTATALGKAKWPSPPQFSQGMDFTLFKSDWSGVKGEMVTAADSVEIEAIGIRDGDLVWLEESAAPDLDRMTVKIFRYFLPHEVPGRLVDGAMLRPRSSPGDGPSRKDTKANADLTLDSQSLSSAPTPASSPTACKRRVSDVNILEGPSLENSMLNRCGFEECTTDKELNQLVTDEARSNAGWCEDEDMRRALALSMEGMQTEEEADKGARRSTVEGNKEEKGMHYTSEDLILLEPGIPAACIHFVRELTVSKDMKLRELKGRIGELAEFCSPLKACNGMLRVREIINGRLVKEFRQEDKILRRMHIGDGRVLAVRIVPREEAVKWMLSQPFQPQLCQAADNLVFADNAVTDIRGHSDGTPLAMGTSVLGLGLGLGLGVNLCEVGRSEGDQGRPSPSRSEVQEVSPHAFLLCVHRRLLLPGNNSLSSVRASEIQTKRVESVLCENISEANGLGINSSRGSKPEGEGFTIPVKSVSCTAIPSLPTSIGTTCGIPSPISLYGAGSGLEKNKPAIPSVMPGVSGRSEDPCSAGVALSSGTVFPSPNSLDTDTTHIDLHAAMAQDSEVHVPNEESCQQPSSAVMFPPAIPEKTASLQPVGCGYPSVAAMAVWALAAGAVKQQAMLMESLQSAAGLVPSMTADSNAETPKNYQLDCWALEKGKPVCELAASSITSMKGPVSARAPMQISTLPFSPLKPVAAKVQPPPLSLNPPSLPMPANHNGLSVPSMCVPTFQGLPLQQSSLSMTAAEKGNSLSVPLTSSSSLVMSACEATQSLIAPLSSSSAAVSGAMAGPMVAPSSGYLGGLDLQLGAEVGEMSESGPVAVAATGAIPRPPPLPVGHGRQVFGFSSPQEVIFDPKVAAPTAGMLRRFLSDVFQIPVERLKVTKLFKNGIWKMLPDDPPKQELKPPIILPPPCDHTVNACDSITREVSHVAASKQTAGSSYNSLETTSDVLNGQAIESWIDMTSGTDAAVATDSACSQSVLQESGQLGGGAMLVHDESQPNPPQMVGEQQAFEPKDDSVVREGEQADQPPHSLPEVLTGEVERGMRSELSDAVSDKRVANANQDRGPMVNAWNEIRAKTDGSKTMNGDAQHRESGEKAISKLPEDSACHQLESGMTSADSHTVRTCQESPTQRLAARNISCCVTHSGIDSVVEAGERDGESRGAVSEALAHLHQSGNGTPLTGSTPEGGSEQNQSGSSTPFTREGCLRGNISFGAARGKSGSLVFLADMNDSGNSTPLRGETLHASLASDGDGKSSSATSLLGPDMNKSGTSTPLTRETLQGSDGLTASCVCVPGGLNIRGQPFLLRDGDILVVADIDDNMYKDDVLMSSAMSVIANGGWGGANANFAGGLISNASAGSNGKASTSGSSASGAEGQRPKSQRTRRPEAALKIRMVEYEE